MLGPRAFCMFGLSSHIRDYNYSDQRLNALRGTTSISGVRWIYLGAHEGPGTLGPGAQGPGTLGPRAQGPWTLGPGAQGPGTLGSGAQGPLVLEPKGPGTLGLGAQGPRTPNFFS